MIYASRIILQDTFLQHYSNRDNFSKKKNNIYPNTNNPFHFTNFTNHLPFTIEYQHALNKFPTTVYHHVKSPHFKRVTTIYILFFYQTPQLRTRTFHTIVHDEGEGRLIRSSWMARTRVHRLIFRIDFKGVGGEATHAKSLLVGGGTRGGWRDGKSKVRVSGSWNRQGCKSSKLVTEPLVALASPALPLCAPLSNAK